MNNLKGVDVTSHIILTRKWMDRCKIDLLIASGIAIVTMAMAYTGTYKIPDPVFTDFYAQDVWFGSDIPTVFGNITSFNSDFGRNNKHPLFPLIVFPLVFGISNSLDIDSLSAVRVLVVFVAVAWSLSLYTLFRVMNIRRLDAVFFSLLGVVSSASIFWLVVPESFSFGSLTIIIGLIFLVLTQYRPFSFIWYVALNIVTVSITITNVMVGIFTTLVNQRWYKTVQIGTIAIVMSTGLWILQRILFTNSGFPFQPGTFIGEKKFISTAGSEGFLAVLSSFFYQTMVMPSISFLDYPGRPDWINLSANPFAPASGGFWGVVAIIAWSGLLGLGLFGYFSTKKHPKLRLVLGLTLAAQLIMHSIYGVSETFIYSLHFIPLLLTLAAFSLFTRFRLIALLLAFVLIISAGINNRDQFVSATTTLWNYGTPQQQVLAQMKLRPNDPWLRTSGYVMLASPGSPTERKAFYQPGGSFSPNPGSFGVSIWVVDQQGNLQATSDNIPLSDIQQQFMGGDAPVPSGVLAKTPFYQASWSMVSPRSWQLDLKSTADSKVRPKVVIRSVGPAGGAINSLDWNGKRLLISDRWILSKLPKSAKVYLGSENTPGWINDQSALSHLEDPYGWGYAQIELNQQEDAWEFVIEDSRAELEQTINSPVISSNLVLDLPDPKFVNSLTAQVSHLLMGLVGTRTHPTDPISAPLPRFRDGAYQLVALARTGQLDVAKQLSPYFAENDFFNSATLEADIPAMGIWALEEVATNLQQPEFDQWLWPHVRRKAEIIGNMLGSNRPGYPVFSTARFPHEEYPDFLQIDLVAGKMENVPGLLDLEPYANAMSYRALLDAASLADRTNHADEAKIWRSQAQELQTAWQQANLLESSALSNGLWPSWIAEIDRPAMVEVLQRHWDQSKDSTERSRQSSRALIAEAHQRLLLNQPNPVWAMLNWLWDNQSSPGLYIWGEGQVESGEMPMPQSLSQWHRFRGRINAAAPAHQYWAAAEMALLQLNMLAYVNQSAITPTLVIGAGVPKEWLNQRMSVKGLLVNGHQVNWFWDGKQMDVEMQDQSLPIKIGAAFPANTPIKVTQLTSNLEEKLV